MKLKIPETVSRVTQILQKAGFEAYVVGGCVRDLILGISPKDWDITTNATPEEIIGLFPDTFYENTFGTVGIVSRETPDETCKVIEVTPYRLETTYSDNRHPDAVIFTNSLHDDLKRRDFTMNAIAYDPETGNLIDPHDGQEDIKNKIIRTVGDPKDRFTEDALRILRGIRFSSQLGFIVSHETLEGMLHVKHLVKNISQERIRDEFTKMIMSRNPMMGIGFLVKLGIMDHIIPELLEGIGCEQKGEHIYDVFDHLVHALEHAVEKNPPAGGWPLDIRLSALFHDIGKPRTRRWDGSKAGGKGKYTFYGHEVVGAKMVKKIMERLRFPGDLSEKVVKLVRYHMFFSDTETITLSAVRRTIVNVGRENIWDLMRVRECDRVGMKKKEAPYRLRKYHAMIEEALRAPTTVGMLKINGEVLIRDLGITPGRRMGWILHALLEECLEDDPESEQAHNGASPKNDIEYLKNRALELDKLSDKELRELGEKGKEKKEETEEKELEKIHKKHGVK